MSQRKRRQLKESEFVEDQEDEGNEVGLPSARDTFLLPTDGRSRYSRRYREVLQSLVSDLGGFEEISTAKLQLCKRAAGLILRLEVYEAHLVNGEEPEDIDPEKSVNALARVLQLIGLDRIAKDGGDIVPGTIEAYFHERGTN